MILRGPLQTLVSDYWDEQLLENPQYATATGDKRYNDRWSDLSDDGRNRALRRSRNFASRLRAISTTGLPRQEVLSAELLERSLLEQQESARFKEWEIPVNQVHGLHFEIPQLVSVTPFDSQKDYENYISRLRRLPALFGQLTANMRRGIRDHRVQPAVVSDQVLAQVEAILAINPDQSPFIAPVKQFPDPIPAEGASSIGKGSLRGPYARCDPGLPPFRAVSKSGIHSPQSRTARGVGILGRRVLL